MSTPSKTESKSENNTDLQRRDEVKASDMDLSAITDFDQALKMAESVWGSAVSVDDTLGDGFTLISDKTTLVNVPFIIVDASWAMGDHGIFWSLRVVTEQGSKFVFNDGSTGIGNQMDMLRDKFGSKDGKRVGNVLVRKGLTYSDYKYTDPKSGDEKPARTYYLSTSA